jgi:protein-tyrosine-phosphatase
MKQIYTTTLRLNLADEDDRRAFEHLRRMDKKRYRSYSKVVVAAVNDYFERQERLTADPYLESREKEDAFLQRVMEAVATGLQASGSQIRTPVSVSSPAEVDNEELSAALDFADGF